ncbi:MAG: hypothetical protein LWY06_19075 [Firmicutes bacterium]|nr:hypothetical protein [Bacillota bacterium]
MKLPCFAKKAIICFFLVYFTAISASYAFSNEDCHWADWIIKLNTSVFYVKNDDLIDIYGLCNGKIIKKCNYKIKNSSDLLGIQLDSGLNCYRITKKPDCLRISIIELLSGNVIDEKVISGVRDVSAADSVIISPDGRKLATFKMSRIEPLVGNVSIYQISDLLSRNNKNDSFIAGNPQMLISGWLPGASVSPDFCNAALINTESNVRKAIVNSGKGKYISVKGKISFCHSWNSSGTEFIYTRLNKKNGKYKMKKTSFITGKESDTAFPEFSTEPKSVEADNSRIVVLLDKRSLYFEQDGKCRCMKLPFDTFSLRLYPEKPQILALCKTGNELRPVIFDVSSTIPVEILKLPAVENNPKNNDERIWELKLTTSLLSIGWIPHSKLVYVRNNEKYFFSP